VAVAVPELSESAFLHAEGVGLPGQYSEGQWSDFGNQAFLEQEWNILSVFPQSIQ